MIKLLVNLVVILNLGLNRDISAANLESAAERYGPLKRIVRYEWPNKRKWLVEFDFSPFGKGWVNHDTVMGLNYIWSNLELLGLIQEIRYFKGCFNPRPVAGTSYPSYHSYGLACDFIPKTGKFSTEFVNLWELYGWCHGRAFNDEMHFSFGKYEC